MAARKAKRLKAIQGARPSDKDLRGVKKKTSRRDVSQTMGANRNTRRLLKKMGFTGD